MNNDNTKQFSPTWFIVCTALVMIVMIALAGLFTGCSTPIGGQSSLDCQKANEAWALYQAALAGGLKPTEDQAKIAAAAKLYLATFCGDVPPGKVVEKPTGEYSGVPTKGTIRQPQRITTADAQGARVIYYRVVPFTIIQNPDGIYPERNPLATITTGPLYRRPGFSGVWMPDENWLRRRTSEPLMQHLW